MRTILLFFWGAVFLLPLPSQDGWHQAPTSNDANRAQQQGAEEDPFLPILHSLETHNPMALVKFLNQGGHLSIWDQREASLMSLLLSRGHRNILTRVASSLTPFDELHQIVSNPLFRTVYLTHTRFNYLLAPKNLTPLQQQVWQGNTEKFLALLPNTDVNESNLMGQSALMLAAAHDRTAILKILLRQGADTERKDRFGYTALAYASYKKHRASIRLLLAAQASPLAGLSPELSPLFITLVTNNRPLATRFYRLAHVAPAVDQKGKLGETLLMYATLYGSLHHVDQLLQLGANPNVAMERGRTPLYYAGQGKDFSRAELFEQYRQIRNILLAAGARPMPEKAMLQTGGSERPPLNPAGY